MGLSVRTARQENEEQICFRIWLSDVRPRMLARIMGESKLRWWPMVDQLVFLDDMDEPFGEAPPADPSKPKSKAQRDRERADGRRCSLPRSDS